jgi:hypothetical protein
MITLAPEVLEGSFEHLRGCGAGRRECVLVWAGPVKQPGVIDEVIHPRHTASAVAYDIDPQWVGELWLALAQRGKTVRAQVHTHPGSAYHSARDDTHGLIHTPGFVSIVIPRFAIGPVGLTGAFVTSKTAAGGWREVDVVDAISVLS